MKNKIDRARWHPNGPHSWLLKCTLKDGGAVLAKIEQNGHAYIWSTSNGGHDWYPSLRGAMRVARETYRLRDS